MRAVLAKSASRIFEYPEASYLSRLAVFARDCERFVPSAVEPLRELHAALCQMTLDELRELYTQTFDLSPSCAPYLSVHLFGESSFKRARLMTGLAELYASRGVPPSQELPDHIGVVLSALESLDPMDQWEVVTHCLVGCLDKMQRELSRQSNPYAHAFAAVEELIDRWEEPRAEVNHG